RPSSVVPAACTDATAHDVTTSRHRELATSQRSSWCERGRTTPCSVHGRLLVDLRVLLVTARKRLLDQARSVIAEDEPALLRTVALIRHAELGVGVEVDDGMSAVRQRAEQDLLRQRPLHLVTNHTLQRARAHDLVEALLRQPLLRRLRRLQRDLPVRQLRFKL